MRTLFDKGEHVCQTDDVYGVDPKSADGILYPDYQFFCINPLKPGTSRRDDNVAVFRNILLEFDKGSLKEQLDWLNEVPYSILTWSGGKSHHAIISLDEPCDTRKEYDALVRRIYAKVPMADKSVKNPSRLSRTPGALRNNGSEQVLVHNRARISQADLGAWLGPEEKKLTTAQPEKRSLGISPWTRNFLMLGAETGKRNASLFAAACDMLRHGYDADMIAILAQNAVDLPEQEIRACIRSAEQAIRREGI